MNKLLVAEYLINAFLITFVSFILGYLVSEVRKTFKGQKSD